MGCIKTIAVFILVMYGTDKTYGRTVGNPIAELENTGKDCWYKCNGKQGPCDWCGSKGFCCTKKNGWTDTSNGCDGSFGGETMHECALQPASQGSDTYEHANYANRGCCINSDFHGSHMHCTCDDVREKDQCREMCSNDELCKGFVMFHYEGPPQCELATSSDNCPYGCRGPFNTDNVAPLDPDGKCGWGDVGAGGCYIKQAIGSEDFLGDWISSSERADRHDGAGDQSEHVGPGDGSGQGMDDDIMAMEIFDDDCKTLKRDNACDRERRWATVKIVCPVSCP